MDSKLSLEEQLQQLKAQLQEKTDKCKRLEERINNDKNNGSFKKYFMQPTCDKINQIIQVLNDIDSKMKQIFDTLVQKEWDIIEERKANVQREKAKVDKLILVIETLLQCISLLLSKAQEILERGKATDEDDKILLLLEKEIQRFINECKQNQKPKNEIIKPQDEINIDQSSAVQEQNQNQMLDDSTIVLKPIKKVKQQNLEENNLESFKIEQIDNKEENQNEVEDNVQDDQEQ